MNDDVGLHARDKVKDALAVANVEFMVNEAWDQVGESFLIPAGVPLRAKKGSALVVVDPMNRAALTGKKKRDLGTDQAGGASDERFHIDPETKWAGPKVKK